MDIRNEFRLGFRECTERDGGNGGMCGGTGVRLTTDEIVKGECEHDGGEGGDGLAVGASG